MMKRELIAMAFASTVWHVAYAGVAAEYLFSNDISGAKQPPHNRHLRYKRTVEIDGARFHIRNDGGPTETSLDDGATTFVGDNRAVTQRPLGALETGCWGGSLGPIGARVKDDKIVISEPQSGPILFGAATRTYVIEHSYVIAVQLACIIVISRMYFEAHYDLTVADLGVSPAALRVALSRGGYGDVLSRHAEAFSGLPLLIDGRVVEGARMRRTLWSPAFM